METGNISWINWNAISWTSTGKKLLSTLWRNDFIISYENSLKIIDELVEMYNQYSSLSEEANSLPDSFDSKIEIKKNTWTNEVNLRFYVFSKSYSMDLI